MRSIKSDYFPGGTECADSVRAAAAFEKAGVDLLDVSGGFCGFTRPGHREPGYFGELTAAIREATDLPVILTGGITAGEEAEALLQAGKADLIGVGRAMLRRPRWAEEAMRDAK